MQKMNRSIELLETLGTPELNIREISNFILYVIYNLPKKEKSVTESRVIMMFGKKEKGKCSKKSKKSIPPDEKSLKMKILRSNFVSHSWKHGLSNDYIHLTLHNVNGNMLMVTLCHCGMKNQIYVPMKYIINISVGTEIQVMTLWISV